MLLKLLLKFQLESLEIEDQDMDAQGFEELAMTARQTCCRAVCLVGCNLTTKKLLKFEEGCGEDGFKVLIDENYFRVFILYFSLQAISTHCLYGIEIQIARHFKKIY